jgi:hypothetical protein
MKCDGLDFMEKQFIHPSNSLFCLIGPFLEFL